jgi:hypothetical protein
MKKLFLSAALVVALSASLQAVPLWMNTASGNSIVADNITVSHVNMSTVPGDAGMGSYFSFVLAPDNGFQIDFTSFSFLAGTAIGLPMNVSFFSSLDGFTNKVGLPISGTPLSLQSALFQGITTPIEFRLYGFDPENGLSPFSISEFAFNGSVSPRGPAPVPESGAGLVAFGAAVGLLAALRYRHGRLA